MRAMLDALPGSDSLLPMKLFDQMFLYVAIVRRVLAAGLRETSGLNTVLYTYVSRCTGGTGTGMPRRKTRAHTVPVRHCYGFGRIVY